jgi:heptose I phosphotransferase
MAEALRGDIFRDKEGRRTLRFELAGNSYFLKLHRGIGWGEITKNLAQLRLPVLGAANEWHAIHALAALGVDTMEACAYGKRGANPAKQLSFIITRDLVNTESLEDYCRDWATQKPSWHIKQALLKRLAWVSKTLHENGINHRDYYLCHFLLDTSKPISGDDFTLSLIDLHRVQIRKRTPKRWAIKDVAGLFYSAMDIGLSQRDLLRFMALYSGKPWRQTLNEDTPFWQAVQQRAEALYRKDMGKAAPQFF